jgi:hypothetical protein
MSRHPTTDLQKDLQYKWDLIRGPLGAIHDRDIEAAENARLEIMVVFEAIADEVARIKRESRAIQRAALYGPDADGRILAALGIPDGHRCWKRLELLWEDQDKRAEETRKREADIASRQVGRRRTGRIEFDSGA